MVNAYFFKPIFQLGEKQKEYFAFLTIFGCPKTEEVMLSGMVDIYSQSKLKPVNKLERKTQIVNNITTRMETTFVIVRRNCCYYYYLLLLWIFNEPVDLKSLVRSLLLQQHPVIKLTNQLKFIFRSN